MLKETLRVVFLIILLVAVVNYEGFCVDHNNITKECNMEQLDLSIRPTKKIFELNESISVEVTFKNTGKKTIFLNDVFNVFQCQLQFDITMPSGGKSQETFIAAGKMRPLCEKDFIKIPKDKVYRKIVDIGKHWYKLDQKGEYLISVIYSNGKSWDELGIRVWTGCIKSKSTSFIIK